MSYQHGHQQSSGCCPGCKKKKCEVIGFATVHIEPTDESLCLSITQPPEDGALAHTTGTPETGGQMTILLSSSGIFNPCTRKICGGGKYMITSTPPNPATDQCGTYIFTKFFSFDECPGRLGKVSASTGLPFKLSFSKSPDNARAGKMMGRVRFDDGDIGTLTFWCRLPQPDPDGIPTVPRGILPEGVVVNKGCIDFAVLDDPNDQVILSPPPASNTLFFVRPRGQLCKVCSKAICKCKFKEFYDRDQKFGKKFGKKFCQKCHGGKDRCCQKKDRCFQKKDHDWDRKDRCFQKKDHDWDRKDRCFQKKDHDWDRKDRCCQKKDHDWDKKDRCFQKKDHDWDKKNRCCPKKDRCCPKKDHGFKAKRGGAYPQYYESSYGCNQCDSKY